MFEARWFNIIEASHIQLEPSHAEPTGCCSAGEGSPIQGLRGPRIDLIGHQLHIADQVARRYAPRVLLADEVGLGKTIEAGLILHQQLQTGRAGRVLIVVPDALVHQWFVEMARRFNLRFSIFDEERLEALGKPSAESVKDMLADLIAGQRITLEKR